jgi:hypothetical protein
MKILKTFKLHSIVFTTFLEPRVQFWQIFLNSGQTLAIEGHLILTLFNF